jgi:hypothetical protein
MWNPVRVGSRVRLSCSPTGRFLASALIGFLGCASILLCQPTKAVLQKQPLDLQACVTTSTSCNHTLTGVLDTSDCLVTSDNSYVDFWSFSGTAGQTVTIDMTSTAFDTYLFLLDPVPNVVASNDDFSGTNSRVTFTLTQTGTWTIGANSAFSGRTGAYSLNLTCTTSTPGSLLLNGNRFRVTATFIANGSPGNGTPVVLTSDTGYFWFFSANNVEMVVKVVDGRTFNNRFWVFAGGLTNVDTTIIVTDTSTGLYKTYHNPANTAFQPIQDTNAF